MAVADVKKYFNQIEKIRNTSKDDLEDFEAALRAGHITEERLQEVKAEFDVIDLNYQRLLYIMWLLTIPDRNSKKAKYEKASQNLIKSFSMLKSDKEAVEMESWNALTQMRTELEKIKKEVKKQD